MDPYSIESFVQLTPPPTVRGRFTIAIPTYNRSNYLRRSLRAALSQTHGDVEVLVCDNASTDDTQSVVSEYGGRVRYYRHDHNIGAYPNFLSATLLATGEFFSWLQDDDLVHREFASRAGRALDESEANRVYSCYVAWGPSDTTYLYHRVYGAGVPLDWQAGATRSFAPCDIAPVGFFHNLGIPPVLAFRTSAIREGLQRLPSDCDLFVERLIPLFVAGRGRCVVEPWVGGLFSKHEHQGSYLLYKSGLMTSHWKAMARRLGDFIEASNDDSWVGFLKDLLSQMSVDQRISWLRDEFTSSIDWSEVHPVAHHVRSLLMESLPADVREPLRRPSRTSVFVREVAPPVILRTAVRIRDAFLGRIRRR